MGIIIDKKKFYKEIRRAITLSVDRFYTDIYYDMDDIRKETIKSLFNEYKKLYQFGDDKYERK